MIEIKAFFLFQGNPQSSDQNSAFWISFTEQTQQYLCTNNIQLKGPDTESKNEQRNRETQQPPYTIEQFTSSQKQKKFKKAWCPPPGPSQSLT